MQYPIKVIWLITVQSDADNRSFLKCHPLHFDKNRIISNRAYEIKHNAVITSTQFYHTYCNRHNQVQITQT